MTPGSDLIAARFHLAGGARGPLLLRARTKGFGHSESGRLCVRLFAAEFRHLALRA